MDPFSIICGVGGLVSITVQIAKILADYASSVGDSPDLANEVASETCAMSIIFRQVQAFMQNADLSASTIDLSPFQETLELCLQTFSQLGALVSGLQDVRDPDCELSGRFKWVKEKDNIGRLLRILNTQKGTLTLLLQLYMCNSNIEQRNPTLAAPAASVIDYGTHESITPAGMARLQEATQHAYDEVLKESRVYRHVKRQNSIDSKITEVTRLTGWSRIPESITSAQFSTYAFASMPHVKSVFKHEIHRVISDFETSKHDELEVRVGQLVRILYAYTDGWVFCVKLDHSQHGVCPRMALSEFPMVDPPTTCF